MSTTTLRDVLNTADLNTLADALRDIKFGDLVTLLIDSLADTETAVVPAADVITLANVPSCVYQVDVATAGMGGVTGIKKLLKGPVSGVGAITPATGECVWDGGLHIKFAAIDIAATVDVAYTRATVAPVASIMDRSLGEQD